MATFLILNNAKTHIIYEFTAVDRPDAKAHAKTWGETNQRDGVVVQQVAHINIVKNITVVGNVADD